VLAGKVQKIGDPLMPEQSDVRPRSKSIPQPVSVEHRVLYREGLSVSGLAGSFSK
jgi:hypothetical protein